MKIAKTASIICQVTFIAKDRTKEYPHGYGIPTTVVIATTYDECKLIAAKLEDDEFAVLNVSAVHSWKRQNPLHKEGETEFLDMFLCEDKLKESKTKVAP